MFDIFWLLDVKCFSRSASRTALEKVICLTHFHKSPFSTLCGRLSCLGLDVRYSTSFKPHRNLQTPAEDDYFNSVDEAPVFHTNGDSADDLQRMIDSVGPPQDTLEPIRWAKGQLIGAGAFGRVYMGMNLDSGELLAVKQVLLATNNTSKEKIQEHLKGLEAEVAVLRNLSHPNIVVSPAVPPPMIY